LRRLIFAFAARTASSRAGCRFSGFGFVAPPPTAGIKGSVGDTAPYRTGCILIGPADPGLLLGMAKQLAHAKFVLI
jgi:hypothetical protein